MKHSKYYYIITALSAILLIVSMKLNYLNNNPIIQEKIVTVEKTVTIPVETIVEIEKVITTEVYIEVPPTYHYNITSTEREMIARILYREAGHASFECQKMIVSVIFNRFDAANGEKTIEDIIYAEAQFTPISIIDCTTPTEENYAAVDEVVKNGSILPNYVRYFRANYHHSWEGYVGYAELDGTFFGYTEKDKNATANS